MKRFLVGVITVVWLICGISLPADAQKQKETAMPLGVYWPENLGFADIKGDERWQKIEELLDSLHKHHVNTIWLNGGSATVQAEYARRAAKRGIKLVAAIGNIHAESGRVRKGDQKKLIETVLKHWGDAPKPLAWGIGDEPYTRIMPEVKTYAEMWKKLDQPITLVEMPKDLPCAVKMLPLDYISSDIYPFFGKNCPNGPSTQAQSQAFLLANMDKMMKLTDNNRKMPAWFMGAIFQNFQGPCDVDEKGNHVILPGGNANFRMPTPAEVKWESWTGIAGGARGIIMFALFFYDEPKQRPLKGDWGLKEKVNTGSPGGILYPDGRKTPQFAALGECFGRISKAAPYITRMVPKDDMLAFHAKGWPAIGDYVRNFVDEKDGSRYVVVVNGDLKEEAVIPVNVDKKVTAAVDLCTGEKLQAIQDYKDNWAPIGPEFRQLQVKLAPGSGTLLRLNMTE